MPQMLPWWFYNFVDIFNSVTGVLTIYFFLESSDTYERDKDNFGE